MNGFVTIVKWLSAKTQKETCRTMEKSIKNTSIHNNHFDNLGEPLNKYVYFDTSLCEYNVIFLYPNGEEGVIEQFADYLNCFIDDEFPLNFIISKYGPVTEYDVKFKPIDIDTSLLATDCHLGNGGLVAGNPNPNPPPPPHPNPPPHPP